MSGGRLSNLAEDADTIRPNAAQSKRALSTPIRASPVSALFQDHCQMQLSTFATQSARSDHSHRSKSQPYSITSSAPASSDAGTVSPSVLAVLRLMTNANLVGNSTGILADRAPLRVLSTSAAARLYLINGVRRVAHEATSFDALPLSKHGGKSIAERERRNSPMYDGERGIGRHD